MGSLVSVRGIYDIPVPRVQLRGVTLQGVLSTFRNIALVAQHYTNARIEPATVAYHYTTARPPLVIYTKYCAKSLLTRVGSERITRARNITRELCTNAGVEPAVEQLSTTRPLLVFGDWVRTEL